jgi:hypothetical protein
MESKQKGWKTQDNYWEVGDNGLETRLKVRVIVTATCTEESLFACSE